MIQQFDNNEKNLSITHIIINKYVIDDRVYSYLPNEIRFKKIVLEIEFICLDKELINKVKRLFNECKIDKFNIPLTTLVSFIKNSICFEISISFCLLVST